MTRSLQPEVIRMERFLAQVCCRSIEVIFFVAVLQTLFTLERWLVG